MDLVAGVRPSLMLKFDPSTVNFVKSPMIFYFIINIMFFCNFKLFYKQLVH
jgi:hypothetical protein